MDQQMDLSVSSELEELVVCSNCHKTFNDTDTLPKLLQCRHYFCQRCVSSFVQDSQPDELYCIHCWKRTELQQSSVDNLPTHNAIVFLTQNFNLSTLNLKMQNNRNNNRHPLGPASNGGNYGPSTKERSPSLASLGSNGLLSAGPNAMRSLHNGNNNNGGGGSPSNGNGANNTTHFDGSNGAKKVGENCMTHAMPLTLWCGTCNLVLCRACGSTEEHRNHVVKNKAEAKEMLHADISHELVVMQNTMNDAQRLVLKQRDFLVKILECCATVRSQIESELAHHGAAMEMAEMRETLTKGRLCLEMIDPESPTEASTLYHTLHAEKQRLAAKHQDLQLQCKLNDLVRECGYVFDFDLIKRTLVQLHSCTANGSNWESVGFGATGTMMHPNPVLLLANYCISQLYTRHIALLKQQQLQQQKAMQEHQHQQPQQQHPTFPTPAPYHHQQLAPQQQQQTPYAPGGPLYQQGGSSPNGNAANGTFYPTYAQALQHNYSKGNPLPDQVSSSNGSPTTNGNGSPYQELSSADLTELGLSLLSLQEQQQQHHHHHLHHHQQTSTSPGLLLNNPSLHLYPIYYFNIDINKKPAGRILIEVRNDVAPIMAKNFNALATHELGYGYKGCSIFQCWDGESVITGDFEHNNGRGGRSVFDEGYFMPDDTKLVAVRGAVGMRRSQKRHDNLGLVGSQFRIILREMRGFTGIFGFVIEGLELVEKISQVGDASGKAQSSVVIANCGKYQLVGQ